MNGDRTHVDLFSGLGGFAFAAHANGVRTVQFCEIDGRCRDFLARAWPGVPIHDDVRTLGVADASSQGHQERGVQPGVPGEAGRGGAGEAAHLGGESLGDPEGSGVGAGSGEGGQEQHRPCLAGTSAWSDFVWLPCADGKVRRAPDDTFGLVDGLHRSVLGALGNSIVPQVAQVLIAAMIQAEEEE